jgi:two-component system, sensor histidine kinase and response regulator
MIVVCESCGKKYRIDESKIKGKGARVRCKSCGRVIVISKEESALEPPTPVDPDDLVFEDEEPEADEPFEFEKPLIEGMSITSKITLVMVLLVLPSLTVAGFMASSQSRNALSNQAESHLLRNARQKSHEYGITFRRIQDEVLGVADYAAGIYGRRNLGGEILILQRIGTVLESIVRNNPFLSRGYFGSETRMAVFDNEETIQVIEDPDGFDVTSRPWYVSAKEAGKTIWTEPCVDADTKQLMVTCATPVFHPNGSLVGVVGFDVLLDTIRTDILTLDVGYRSYAFLVNRKGNVLVRPGMQPKDVRWDATYKTDDLLHTRNPSFNQVVRKMTGGSTGIDTYATEEGERYIAYAPIRPIDASMGIVASRDEVTRPADAIQRTIIIIWLVVLVIAVAIGLYLGNSITRSIKELTLRADLIGQGKMDLDIMEEDRKDEIGVLIRAFNRLVKSLRLAMSR